jgi:hypothetical protein
MSIELSFEHTYLGSPPHTSNLRHLLCILTGITETLTELARKSQTKRGAW